MLLGNILFWSKNQASLKGRNITWKHIFQNTWEIGDLKKKKKKPQEPKHFLKILRIMCVKWSTIINCMLWELSSSSR